ncbi:uracil-DNA glycosylase-like isoform X2 [Oculina patagonica]
MKERDTGIIPDRSNQHEPYLERHYKSSVYVAVAVAVVAGLVMTLYSYSTSSKMLAQEEKDPTNYDFGTTVTNHEELHYNSDMCKELLERATYETHTLMEIVYGSACKPIGWEEYFDREDVREMMQEISDQLQNDSQVRGLGINPDIGWIFRALHMVPPKQVRAIIIGQDPAPQPGLATGLAFSLAASVHPTNVPSVQRVILEARNEGYCVDPTNGVLESWAKQGVLLLNTALTLIQNDIGSHIPLWSNFSQEVIKYINDNTNPSVWLLWGSKAKALEGNIDKSKHYIVKGGHPSPNAEGKYFFCQNYFSCANEWLSNKGRGVVDWNLVSLPCNKYDSHLYERIYDDPGYSKGEKCEMQACPEY